MKKSMLFGMLSGALLVGCAINAHAAAPAPTSHSLASPLVFKVQANVPAITTSDIVASVDHDTFTFNNYDRNTNTFAPGTLSDAFRLNVPHSSTDVNVKLLYAPTLDENGTSHAVTVSLQGQTLTTTNATFAPITLGASHAYDLDFSIAGAFTTDTSAHTYNGSNVQLMFSATY